MSQHAGSRLLDMLPALYRGSDESGDLQRFLAAFEAMFLPGEGVAPVHPALPALEKLVVRLPTLFAPEAGLQCVAGESNATPAEFLHWLAQWLGFVPHALFTEDELRRILVGLIPLYGWRGTRRYLDELLRLCFGARLARIEIDDRPGIGLTAGRSRIGVDTWLATSRPHWFIVTLQAGRQHGADPGLKRQVSAVIDFARPAHTRFEIRWSTRAS